MGGAGKSRVNRFLCAEMDAVSLSGKMADMAYMYKHGFNKIAVFDISRAQADYSDHVYSMAEQLKNGMVCTTKYTSASLMFRPPHVVIFSNRTWDREKLSHDRVVEMDLSNPAWHQMPDLPPVPEVDVDLDALLADMPLDAFW